MTRSGYRAIACVATIAVLVVVGCASGAAGFVTDGSAQAALQRLVAHNEALAVAAYCALVIAGCAVLAVPGAVYAVAAAALFGPLMGTVWCSLAATAGAVLAFLASRFFLRDAVRPRVLRHDLLRRWLFSGSRRNEVATLAVTRLVPLFPFNVQNFAYGVTDLGFWTYTVLTFVFMLPGVSFYTIGAAGLTAGEDAWKYFLTAGILAVLVTLLGIWIKKKFLTENEKEAYAIMTRVPEAGKTKTRLMPLLSGEECKELHEAFLADLEELFLKEGTGPDVYVYYLEDGPSSEARIKSLLPGAKAYIPQEGTNLGEKMEAAFRILFQRGYERILLTGTDIPELSPGIVKDAFSALSDHQVVLNPTADGGYYLVGMQKPWEIFSVKDYGTGSVFSDTCRNIEEKGLSLSVGESLMDLDTPEDLRAIGKRYREGGPCLWKHTAEWILGFREKEGSRQE